MKLNDMLELGDLDPNQYKGFTIKKGKKIYWYIIPMPKSGLYKCLPVGDDYTLGWPRWIPGNTKVHLVPKL